LNNKFILDQNFPNPVVSSTNISFSLGKNTINSELKIYNIKGQIVKKFELNGNNYKTTGNVVWHGKDEYGKKVANGIYFYKLISEKKQAIRKMILMR